MHICVCMCVSMLTRDSTYTVETSHYFTVIFFFFLAAGLYYYIFWSRLVFQEKNGFYFQGKGNMLRPHKDSLANRKCVGAGEAVACCKSPG